MTGFTIGYDVTHANLPHAPAGQLAGYATGVGADVRWTAADWAAHPGAIRIAQSPVLATDEAALADVLDVESMAATLSDCAPWARDAQASFAARRRPGQRRPAIYFSAFNVHNVVNALIGGGVTSGVGLWVANWSLGEAQAVADVLNGAGPFPVIGVQFRNDGAYDVDIWSAAWLADVSQPAAPVPPSPVPPSWPAGVVLRLGSSGGAVEVLQRALHDSGIRGVRGITVDGVFGPQTETAVRNFQAAKGLLTDGIAGQQVRRALGV